MTPTAPHNAPVPSPDCQCKPCQWANARIEADRRLDEDLEANYQRYLAGELVAKDGRE